MREKLQLAKEITDLGKNRMKKLLANPEKHKALIDKAYDEVWQIYVEQLAKYREN